MEKQGEQEEFTSKCKLTFFKSKLQLVTRWRPDYKWTGTYLKLLILKNEKTINGTTEKKILGFKLIIPIIPKNIKSNPKHPIPRKVRVLLGFVWKTVIKTKS